MFTSIKNVHLPSWIASYGIDILFILFIHSDCFVFKFFYLGILKLLFSMQINIRFCTNCTQPDASNNYKAEYNVCYNFIL